MLFDNILHIEISAVRCRPHSIYKCECVCMCLSKTNTRKEKKEVVVGGRRRNATYVNSSSAAVLEKNKKKNAKRMCDSWCLCHFLKCNTSLFGLMSA
jgi:hypothetical protein